MTSSELATNFKQLESQIAVKKGDFTLFALFLREAAPNRWDLMVSAPWLGSNSEAAVRYLVGEIKSTLGDEFLVPLSRIVVLDPNDTAVRSLNQAIKVEHGSVEVRDSNFFGLPIKHAYLITSKLLSASVPG